MNEQIYSRSDRVFALVGEVGKATSYLNSIKLNSQSFYFRVLHVHSQFIFSNHFHFASLNFSMPRKFYSVCFFKE